MDGQLTCEQLRNIAPLVNEKQLKSFVDETVDRIKNEVVVESFKQAKYPHAVPKERLHKTKAEIPRGYTRRSAVIDEYRNEKRWELFDMVISGLKQTFPDMKITTDPTREYILLDWS